MAIKTTRGFRLSLAASLVAVMGFGAAATGQKFYSDDPIGAIVDSQDASSVEKRDIDLLYDTLENSFAWPGDQTPDVRAQNVNTVDEVPDSAWFTNRMGARAMTVEEVLRGPDTGTGPAAGQWTVIAAKNDGVTPGFTVRDSAEQVWFIKFDPPGYPAMATGTEVVVTKLLWALGYNVPENHIANVRLEQLSIDESARMTPPSGRERRMKPEDIRAVLRNAHREADGSYRIVASKALEGRPVGGFRFYGVRSDDPNDLVAHEHRRELRAYGTFAAWVNHVDSKSINTLDTRNRTGRKKIVRHHLIDFGSTIGSAGVYPREAYRGLGIPHRRQEDARGYPDLRALRQELAHNADVSGAIGWCVHPRQLDAGIPRRGGHDTPTPRSGRRDWTTSSGLRSGCRLSPTTW